MQPNKYLVFTDQKKKIFEGSTTSKWILILMKILPRNPRKKYK